MAHIFIWRTAILFIALVPLAYYIVATVAAVRFFRRERARRVVNFTPPVSVLKPIHGVDFASYENFASFCRQNYPEYEILYCVNDLSDPAVPVIRKIMSQYPQRQIRILSNAPRLGANRKV